MRIALVSDVDLSIAINKARQHARNPARLLEKYGYKDTREAREVTANSARAQLAILLELQWRRKLHGALPDETLEV